MSQANVDALKGGYDAFARGDIEAVLELMTDDVEWVETGVTPSRGRYHGKEAVRSRWLASVGQSFDEFTVSPERFIDAGDHVAVLGTGRVRLKGVEQPVTGPVAHIWRFEGGKIASARFVFADGPRIDSALREAGIDP